MLGLPDTCTTHVHIYMYNVCCNSDQLIFYSQEQQYKDKVIKNLQSNEMGDEWFVNIYVLWILRH